jgi:hypothetical protein
MTLSNGIRESLLRQPLSLRDCSIVLLGPLVRERARQHAHEKHENDCSNLSSHFEEPPKGKFGSALVSLFLRLRVNYSFLSIVLLCSVAMAIPAAGQSADGLQVQPAPAASYAQTKIGGLTALLPDPAVTPGLVRPDATLESVCHGGSTKQFRKTTAEMKAKVYAQYGIDKSKPLPMSLVACLAQRMASPAEPCSILSNPGIRSTERMSARASSPESLDRARAGSAANVHSMGDGFQVIRVDAQGIPANVVKFFPFRDWAAKYAPDKKVRSDLSPAAISAVAHSFSFPNPAPVRIEFNPVTENPSNASKDGGHAGQESYYEIDHLISLELGGADDVRNLWPEPYTPRPGAHEKDSVENYLHAQVCNGKMDLAEAQRAIVANWLDIYVRMPKKR